MAAVKRTLFKFRLGDDAEPETDTPTTDDSAPLSFEEETEARQGPPYAWLGLGAVSLAGLAASGYKLVQYWKSAKETARTEEPWRVDAAESRVPDDAGTASLVGLLFVGGLAAVGKRLERDSWE
ncbi:hypothetical protein SAMN04487949_1284 [Halogranum gelatinilyticum]|uniref:Uncharacterized protein n=1 Tax=Halogranum gelatinilyticum TaxID=660521 RepID=A0A1G9RCB4_9EURY|nr:hypothetical protein [Halogranum gelatinilyticum]SDM20959.1 hypothetical protein SAMN04487949_1284 [Halogranum gelatinilyticum]